MTNTLLRLTHDFSTNVVATELIPAIIWVSVGLVSPSTWGREKLHNTFWKRVAWVAGRKCNPTTKVRYPHPTPSFRNTNFAKVLSHAYPTQGIADAKAKHCLEVWECAHVNCMQLFLCMDWNNENFKTKLAQALEFEQESVHIHSMYIAPHHKRELSSWGEGDWGLVFKQSQQLETTEICLSSPWA